MSEKVLGKILRKGYRNKLMLATKLPTWLVNERKDMDRYLDEQLERLQTDHIDFYLIHGLGKDRWEHMKSLGVTDFIDSAKKDGRIIHAGFSYHDEPGNFKDIVDAYSWDFCQIQLNFMDTDYQAGEEGLRYAAKKGLGVVIMEPLKGGQLTTVVPPVVQETWGKAKTKRTPAEWGLKFVWDYPEVSVVLSGMSTLEQVKENVRLADDAHPGSLTKKEKGLIDEVKKAYESRIAVGCTDCKYCMPCPSGVNIPENFRMLNNARMFGSADSVKMAYKMFMPENERASNCAQCGECEEKCPQHLPIREKLEEVDKTLG
jgi:predicted aldo/keto reductase-like oxidoreductase